MSSIAEALLGKDAAKAIASSAAHAKRVHRIDDDEEEHVPANEPAITPFVVADARGELLATRPVLQKPRRRREAKENAMPRGIYKRKKRAAGEGEAGAAVKERPAKAKRGRRAAAAGGGEAHFIVDDMGCIAVEKGGARVDLSLPDTKRLAAFIERTKAFRT